VTPHEAADNFTGIPALSRFSLARFLTLFFPFFFHSSFFQIRFCAAAFAADFYHSYPFPAGFVGSPILLFPLPAFLCQVFRFRFLGSMDYFALLLFVISIY